MCTVEGRGRQRRAAVAEILDRPDAGVDDSEILACNAGVAWAPVRHRGGIRPLPSWHCTRFRLCNGATAGREDAATWFLYQACAILCAAAIKAALCIFFAGRKTLLAT
jgi:hypothetical protein